MAPPKRDTEAVLVRLHRKTLDAIDKVREGDPEVSSRQEMIRHILIEWLHAKGIDARE